MAIEIVMFVILAVPGVSMAYTRDMSFKHLPQYQNKRFIGDLQHEGPALSTLDCGLQCNLRDHCQMFTSVKNDGSAGFTCWLHWDVGTSSLLSAPGAESFAFEQNWLNRPCSSDGECGIKLPINYETKLGNMTAPVCFQDLCLCYPGYFYSLQQNLCVQNCSSSDLQDSYTRYPNSGVDKNNHYVSYGTLGECKANCSSYNDCENFEIHTSGSPPYVCKGARLSGYSNGFTLAQDFDHYQRDCA